MKTFYLNFTRVFNPAPKAEPATRRISDPSPAPKPFDMKVEGKAIIPAENARQALDTFEKEFPGCDVNSITNGQD